MTEMEQCLFICRRLLALLEEDEAQISQAMMGQMLDGYRDAVNMEKDSVRSIIHMLQNCN